MSELSTVARAHRRLGERGYNRAALTPGGTECAAGDASYQGALMAVCPGRSALRRVRYG